MTDVPAARRRNMSAIRQKDTKPEIKVRSALYADGFRYRLHLRSLPGTPDIVLAKYRVTILVNGCFWHMHECTTFRWPKTRSEFWRDKLHANRERDLRQIAALIDLGWRVAVIWECSLRETAQSAASVATLKEWMLAGSYLLELAE